MTTCYVDTSALVKRYVDEVGSDWVRAMLGKSPLQLFPIGICLLMA